jgi:hypothetical protein
MTVPAATTQTFQQVGTREDLSDIIYDLSPTETPFVQKAARTKAKQVFHEWQTDVLASAAANKQIEGDDASSLTMTPTVRLGNYTQISAKAIVVSGTADATDKAGRKSELSYQLMKRGKELKRDIEYAVTQNQGSTAGGVGTARSLASVESWLATNRTSATGGASTTPGFSSGTVTAPTDATVQTTLSEANLKAVISACWTQGGQPEMVLVGSYNKQKISAFSGIATQTYNYDAKWAKQGAILAAADVYVSDFGVLQIVPSRFNRDRTALVLDMEYWAIAYLRPFTQYELAKTGDAEKRQMLVEFTLEAKNEKASGKVTDLATS